MKKKKSGICRLNANKRAVTTTFHWGFYANDVYFKASTQLVPVVSIIATYIF